MRDKDLALIEAAMHGQAYEVGELLRNGADPNATSPSYTTSPIMYASLRGSFDMVRLLLEFGADPKVKNDRGETAIILASLNDKPDIIEILIKHGADPCARNNRGKDALYYAQTSHHKRIVQMLEPYETANKNMKHIKDDLKVLERGKAKRVVE